MKKIFFIEGDDAFKKEIAVKEILAAHSNYEVENLDSNILFEDYPLLLLEQGLFANQMIYKIRQPKWLMSSWSKSEEAVAKEMEKNIELMNHRLIVILDGQADKRKKSVKWLQKLSEYTICNSFKEWEEDKAFLWLKNHLTKERIAVEDAALRMLLEYEGLALNQVISQIKVLVNYVPEGQVIKEQHVLDNLGDKHQSIFQLSDLLQKGNFSAVFCKVKDLVKQGEDPIKLIGFLAKQIMNYQTVLIFNTLSDASLAKKLGKHPFVVKQMRQALKKWLTPKSLANLLFELSDADVKIKAGRFQADLALKKAMAAWKNCENSIHKSV